MMGGARGRNEGDALMDAVFAAPDDDAPRRVLADWLRGQSDPVARARGELIQLQLAPSEERENAGARRRENAILQKYQRAFLGRLAPVVRHAGAVFERGFLDRCAIRPGAAPAGDPLWSTVRSIELERFADTAFLAHPVMRSLRHLKGIDRAALVHLATLHHPMRIESIASSGIGFPDDAEAAIAESRGLPSLRSLELLVAEARPSPRLLGGALGRHLETLWLRGSGYAGPLAPWLQIVRERELPLARLQIDCFMLEVSLERGLDGRLSSLTARVAPKGPAELHRALAGLRDGDLRHARIHTGGKLTAAQREELEREVHGRLPSLNVDFV